MATVRRTPTDKKSKIKIKIKNWKGADAKEEGNGQVAVQCRGNYDRPLSSHSLDSASINALSRAVRQIQCDSEKTVMSVILRIEPSLAESKKTLTKFIRCGDLRRAV